MASDFRRISRRESIEPSFDRERGAAFERDFSLAFEPTELVSQISFGRRRSLGFRSIDRRVENDRRRSTSRRENLRLSADENVAGRLENHSAMDQIGQEKRRETLFVVRRTFLAEETKNLEFDRSSADGNRLFVDRMDSA